MCKIVCGDASNSFFLVLGVVGILAGRRFRRFTRLFFGPMPVRLSVGFLVSLIGSGRFGFLTSRFPLFPFSNTCGLSAGFCES